MKHFEVTLERWACLFLYLYEGMPTVVMQSFRLKRHHFTWMEISRIYLYVLMSDVWAAWFLLKCTIIQHFINSCLFVVSPYLESSFTTPHAAKNIHLKPWLEKKQRSDETIHVITNTRSSTTQTRSVMLILYLNKSPFRIAVRFGGGYFLQCARQWAEQPPHPAVNIDGISRTTSIWHKLRRVRVGSSRKVD